MLLSMPHLRSSDGLSLTYDDDDGSGAGEPVVLLHGLGASRKHWDGSRAALLDAGYRVVRADLRGFGDSELPQADYPFSRLIDDFGALLREVGLAETPIHLVGHSLGGMIAQRYVLDHPAHVESLTLCSTMSHLGRRATAFARALILLSRSGFDAAVADAAIRAEVERVLGDAFQTPPPIELFRRGLESPNPAQAMAWTSVIGFSVKDELHAVRCPVLVLHGSADPLLPIAAGRATHYLLGSVARWVEIPGAGHLIPARETEAFTRELLDFLAGVRAALAVEPGA